MPRLAHALRRRERRPPDRRLQLGHGRRARRGGAARAASATSPATRAPRSFASTSSRFPSRTRRARASSTAPPCSRTRDRRHGRPLARRRSRRRDAGNERRPTSATTSRCSRRPASPRARARATASCSTSAIRSSPKRIDAVVDKGFAYWHSATFNNDGTKVVFTDEWGGGSARAAARTTRSIGAPTRSTTSSTASSSIAATSRCRRRKSTRKTASRTTARSIPCRDATSWSSPGIRAASRCGISRTRRRPSRSPIFDRGPIDAEELVGRRLLVVVLVRRPHLRHGDRARPRRVRACGRASFLTENEIAAAVLADQGALFNPQQQFPRRRGRPSRSSRAPMSISFGAAPARVSPCSSMSRTRSTSPRRDSRTVQPTQTSQPGSRSLRAGSLRTTATLLRGSVKRGLPRR